MTKVYIELDYEVVQQAIRAKVPDAVVDVLRRYDLQRMIEAAITSDEKPKTTDTPLGFMATFNSISLSPREVFENMLRAAVDEAIAAAATDYLRAHPELFEAAMLRAISVALARLKLKVEDDDE